MNNRRTLFLCLGTITGIMMAWSLWRPTHGYVNWLLECFPVLIVATLLLWTGRRFPLTSMAYILIAIHAGVLMVGGHYTYAEVPLFNWIRDEFGLARNHYDRLGHFMQGFVPAIVVREILIRRSPLRPGKWLFFLVVCVCLSFSAFYELLEWQVAIHSDEAGVAFLGTQGDVWDTQWDMALAMMGALASQAILGRWHQRQIRRLDTERKMP